MWCHENVHRDEHYHYSISSCQETYLQMYIKTWKKGLHGHKVCREGEICKPSTCTNIVLLKVHPYLCGESCSGKIVVGGNSFLILKKSYLECCCSVSSDFAAFVSFIKNQYYTITSTMHSFFPFTSSSSERAKYPSREGNEFIFGWFQYWINGVIL